MTGIFLANSVANPGKNLILSAGAVKARDMTTDIVLAGGVEFGQNALDVGSSYIANGSYHVFLAMNPAGDVKPVVSRSALNPAVGDYTKFRRIHGFLTDGSANIYSGNWCGDRFTFNRANFWASTAAPPAPNPQPILSTPIQPFTQLRLVPQMVPIGWNVRVRAFPVMFNATGALFVGIFRNPEDGVPSADTTLVQYGLVTKSVAAANMGDAIAAEELTSADGRLFVGAYPQLASNNMHIYAQGWIDTRNDVGNIMGMPIIGASLTGDISANNWPQYLAAELMKGKSTRVVPQIYGREGAPSSVWIASGEVDKAASQRAQIVLIDPTADANSGFAIPVMQALSNLYQMVDIIHGQNPNTKIGLCTMNRMMPQATQFANVQSYYANIDTVIANRPNVFKIDCWSAWGDPTLNPSDYNAGEYIHCNLNGNRRVTIPVHVAALSPLIS